MCFFDDFCRRRCCCSCVEIHIKEYSIIQILFTEVVFEFLRRKKWVVEKKIKKDTRIHAEESIVCHSIAMHSLHVSKSYDVFH